MNSNITIGKNSAYFTYPDVEEKVSAIILVHEVWGLTDHIKDVAERLMREGYAVLAPDLLSHTGITEKIDQSIMKEVHNPATRDEAQKKMRAATAPMMSPEFAQETIASLQECYKFLEGQLNINEKIAVMGFCFGGTYAWNLSANQKNLACAVAFYGHAPGDEPTLAKIDCPLLAFYGEMDGNLVKDLPRLEQTMDRLEKNFDYITYPKCGHAFFNNTNPTTYNQTAAEDSWAKTQAFLKENL